MVILKGGDFVASLFVVNPILCVVIVFALCFVMWLFVSYLCCQSSHGDMKNTSCFAYCLVSKDLFCWLCLNASSSWSCGCSVVCDFCIAFPVHILLYYDSGHLGDIN